MSSRVASTRRPYRHVSGRIYGYRNCPGTGQIVRQPVCFCRLGRPPIILMAMKPTVRINTMEMAANAHPRHNPVSPLYDHIILGGSWGFLFGVHQFAPSSCRTAIFSTVGAVCHCRCASGDVWMTDNHPDWYTRGRPRNGP